MQDTVHKIWYGNSRWFYLLIPLEILFRSISWVRRSLYRFGVFKTNSASVPVVVIGNITAGGTGKTPVTLWLAEQLRSRGFSPGIVSRGYGGEARGLRVDVTSTAEQVGDEPLLLARRSGCPVIVDADRSAAAQRLAETEVDVVIADDGLQHYALHRDYEVCVVDAARGFGNGHQLPAGPLREHTDRLLTVDQVLINGSGRDDLALPNNALEFHLELQQAVRVNGNGRSELSAFANQPVNAAAAIGNPQRFFQALRDAGLEITEYAFPDHAAIDIERFAPGVPLLLTEKDAVKLQADTADHVWFVPVTLKMDETMAAEWLSRVVARLKGDQT